VIHARALTRTFPTTTAVDQVDLDVAPGAIFGLLGPDGAGKTTLLRMLAGVLDATSGAATVAGYDVASESQRVAERIGYMPQRYCLYPDLTVAENLEFFGTLRGVSGKVRRERESRLLTAMGLDAFRTRRAGKLSGGMKQKLMLTTCLLHEPTLLLLDEPTTGVDPLSRRELWRILADLRDEGRTVIVATPYMDEAARCSDIAFMEAGVIRHRGTPAEITALVPGTLLEVSGPDPRALLGEILPMDDVIEAHLYSDVVRVLSRSGDPAVYQREDVTVRTAPVDMETAFAYLAGREAA
jgi:ABC-2 type transport system ATP-binding protein